MINFGLIAIQVCFNKSSFIVSNEDLILSYPLHLLMAAYNSVPHHYWNSHFSLNGICNCCSEFQNSSCELADRSLTLIHLPFTIVDNAQNFIVYTELLHRY